MAAHQNNLTEIQAGRAALKKSSNDVVRRHGQLFITDHTRLDADLRASAQQLNVSLPSQPNAKQRATLASVSALSGTAFDAAWLRSQLTGHGKQRPTASVSSPRARTGRSRDWRGRRRR